MTALQEPMSDTGEQQFGAVLDLPLVALPEGLAVIDLGEVPPVDVLDEEQVARVEGWRTTALKARGEGRHRRRWARSWNRRYEARHAAPESTGEVAE